MRTATCRALCGLAAAGAVVALRPGTRAHRVARHQLAAVGRHLRHFGGRLHGVRYRLQGRHPDADVSGKTLADRVRSSLGPLEKRLDLPHVHVTAEDHVVLLHGEVVTRADAEEIEAAVAAVPGVARVESYMHVGLARGDTRPSAGQAVDAADVLATGVRDNWEKR